MSWDAYLHCDACGHAIGNWNYTHNTNGMIVEILRADGAELGSTWWDELRRTSGTMWWRLLDGLDGAAGAALLDGIVRALEAESGRFRAMNPVNGWGDYDGLLKTLQEMRASVPEAPTHWSVHG